MKIEAVSAVFPSRVVNNQHIIDLVREASAPIFTNDLEKFLKTLRKLLEYTGIHTRYWLSADETPLQLIQQAFNQALTPAQWQKEDIDLVIYVGVGRAVLEPGNSYLFA